MSERGIIFVDRWLTDNVAMAPDGADLCIDDLTYRLVTDAQVVGINREELYHGIESLYRRILKAVTQ